MKKLIFSLFFLLLLINFSSADVDQVADFVDVELGFNKSLQYLASDHFIEEEYIQLEITVLEDDYIYENISMHYGGGTNVSSAVNDFVNVSIWGNSDYIWFIVSSVGESSTGNVRVKAFNDSSGTWYYDTFSWTAGFNSPSYRWASLNDYVVSDDAGLTLYLDNFYADYDRAVLMYFYNQSWVQMDLAYYESAGCNYYDEFSVCMLADRSDYQGRVLTFNSTGVPYNHLFYVYTYSYSYPFDFAETSSFRVNFDEERFDEGGIGLPASSPPYQIASINDITVYEGDTWSNPLSYYFSNFDTASIRYYDPDLDTGVEVYRELGQGLGCINSNLRVCLTGYIDDIYLTVENLGFNDTIYVNLSVFNSVGTVSKNVSISSIADTDIPSIHQIEEEDAFIGILSGLLDGIYPPHQNLSIKERFAYVAVTFMLLTILILALGYGTKNINLAIYLAITCDIILFFYFLAIKYIPVSVLITTVVIGISIGYIKLRS